jgi:hypothetical protein
MKHNSTDITTVTCILMYKKNSFSWETLFERTIGCHASVDASVVTTQLQLLALPTSQQSLYFTHHYLTYIPVLRPHVSFKVILFPLNHPSLKEEILLSTEPPISLPTHTSLYRNTHMFTYPYLSLPSRPSLPTHLFLYLLYTGPKNRNIYSQK